MRRPAFAMLLLGSSLATFITVSGERRVSGQGPDLVAKGSCQFVESTRASGRAVVITTKNVGNDYARPSTTLISFPACGSSYPFKTIGLRPGDSVEMTMFIAPDCFSPNCHFRITADANNNIQETREDNNLDSGKCYGQKPKAY